MAKGSSPATSRRSSSANCASSLAGRGVNPRGVATFAGFESGNSARAFRFVLLSCCCCCRGCCLVVAAVVTIARCCLCCYQGAGRVWPCVCRWMRKIEAAQATETKASNRDRGKQQISRQVAICQLSSRASKRTPLSALLRTASCPYNRNCPHRLYGNGPYIYLQRNQSFNGLTAIYSFLLHLSTPQRGAPSLFATDDT